MSSTQPQEAASPTPPRKRMTHQDRRRQLLDVSWGIVRHEGTDVLTLGRLAERAGVTKPVVYGHFGTRNGLLVALYKDFDDRQNAVLGAALQTGEPTLKGRASVIADSYVNCVLLQGREIPGVLAALAGSPELEEVKRAYLTAFIEKCRAALAPFVGPGEIGWAGFWGMIGAAESLSHAAASGEITPDQARAELFEVIVSMVGRGARGPEPRPM